MAFRVLKQLMPAPTSSVDRHGNSFDDPWWASRDIYVAKLSGSGDQTWQFSSEGDATTKMNELAGADSSGREYKVIEV